MDATVYDKALVSPVFAGLDRQALEDLFADVNAVTRRYKKGESVCLAGAEMKYFPVLLQGKVQSSMPREDGTSQIIARFTPGSSFAEAVPSGVGISPVDIVALEDSWVLQLPAANLRNTTNPNAAIVHANLMAEMAKKVAWLSKKLALLNEPRLRTRVLLYLEGLQPDDDGWLVLPFSRKDWAEYLGANDKALLRELRRMREDGILQDDGKRFRLLKERGF